VLRLRSGMAYTLSFPFGRAAGGANGLSSIMDG